MQGENRRSRKVTPEAWLQHPKLHSYNLKAWLQLKITQLYVANLLSIHGELFNRKTETFARFHATIVAQLNV